MGANLVVRLILCPHSLGVFASQLPGTYQLFSPTPQRLFHQFMQISGLGESGLCVVQEGPVMGNHLWLVADTTPFSKVPPLLRVQINFPLHAVISVQSLSHHHIG